MKIKPFWIFWTILHVQIYFYWTEWIIKPVLKGFWTEGHRKLNILFSCHWLLNTSLIYIWRSTIWDWKLYFTPQLWKLFYQRTTNNYQKSTEWQTFENISTEQQRITNCGYYKLSTKILLNISKKNHEVFRETQEFHGFLKPYAIRPQFSITIPRVDHPYAPKWRYC